jgi:hypothetical protein
VLTALTKIQLIISAALPPYIGTATPEEPATDSKEMLP